MTLAGHLYEAHLHNSKCSEDDIRWSQRFSFVLRRFHNILSIGRLFSQKKHIKVPELCRSDVGYLWLLLLFKSARTYWTTYLRWTRSIARKIWITYERAYIISKLIKPTWWPHGIHIPGSLILKAWRHFSWFGQRAKTCWDVQDKVDILSGWHFVLPPNRWPSFKVHQSSLSNNPEILNNYLIFAEVWHVSMTRASGPLGHGDTVFL